MLLLVAEDPRFTIPAERVVEVVVLRFEERPESKRVGCQVIVTLSPDRPGPYRTLTSWDDPDEIDAALDAAQDLADMMASDADGVMSWSPEGEWVLRVPRVPGDDLD